MKVAFPMKKCPACGATYAEEIVQCPADGALLAEIPTGSGVQGQMPAVPPATRRVPTFVWILVGLGGFLLLCIPVLMLIAIPTMGNMRRFANETSAQQSIRTINMAQTQYEVAFPANGFSCSLSALGGDPKSGPPAPTNAEILQQDLASGTKAGYKFTIVNCVKIPEKGIDRITAYSVIAQPLTVGKTGNRTFCSDETGQITFDPTGGTNCTQELGQ
ncbi:MAG TPA: hypothetical protein VG225_00840 [Terracidiphilus sp.]|jgi:type IV pilus assembly protein PilA|nr:hypothetical protein [Terracidiphilus sp.]